MNSASGDPLSKLLATSNFQQSHLYLHIYNVLGKCQWTIMYSKLITLYYYNDLRKIRTVCGIAMYIEGKSSVSLIHGNLFCQ